MSSCIYLDNASTTAVDLRVMEEMLPFFTQYYGNASSTVHQYGWEANEAIDQAKLRLTDLLQVKKEELIFTSGATESINLALRGVFDLYAPVAGRHIISCKTEHKAVLDTLDALEKKGATISWLTTDIKGRISLSDLKKAIQKDTILVCLMHGNNETGVVHPISQIGEICKEEGVLLFCDATQTVGKIPVHPRKIGASLLALSGHKFYGPKGIGALYISSENPRVKLRPQIVGGGQQNGIRSGTLNVTGIVGLGKAAQLAKEQIAFDFSHAANMIDSFFNALENKLDGIHLNTPVDECLPHIINFSIEGVNTPELLAKISNKVAISAGSACSSNSGRPSHVLKAMGLSQQITASSVRVSVGRFTSEGEMKSAAQIIIDAVKELRADNYRVDKSGVG
ncbi:MAG: cysteine desulfurase [Saprospirales bacterium]|nr:MAG: cysteine desulfurase [Saprospirales bacterium]